MRFDSAFNLAFFRNLFILQLQFAISEGAGGFNALKGCRNKRPSGPGFVSTLPEARNYNCRIQPLRKPTPGKYRAGNSLTMATDIGFYPSRSLFGYPLLEPVN